jgi:TetR/AcrR family transcriptional repressor of nem operon
MPRPRELNEFDVVDAAFRSFGASNFPDAPMRKLAFYADVNYESLYNAFAGQQSLLRSGFVECVERSFRRATRSEQPQLSPFSKIERFVAEAVEACAQSARNGARLPPRAGFETENRDRDCSAIVSEEIDGIEKYLTDCASAGQFEGEILRTQPSLYLGGFPEDLAQPGSCLPVAAGA